MSPTQTTAIQSRHLSQASKETRHMPIRLHRILDVAASILIVLLASFTAGATAILGA